MEIVDCPRCGVENEIETRGKSIDEIRKSSIMDDLRGQLNQNCSGCELDFTVFYEKN